MGDRDSFNDRRSEPLDLTKLIFLPVSPECDFPDFRWRETNSDPCLAQKILGLSGGYGYAGVLRKQQIVRADQAVKAEAGLLNAQRGG